MGLLDFLGSLGAGGGSAMQHLTSGLGGQGGFLQHMGLGQYGGQAGAAPPGMAGQMGQGNNWTTFLHGLGDRLSGGGGGDGGAGGQGGAQGSPMAPAPNLMPQGGGSQSAGLSDLVAQYLKMNQRR